MKKTFSILLICVSVALPVGMIVSMIAGCSTTQQESALANLTKLGNVVGAGYQEYLGLVAAGVVPTNNVAQITKQYAEFQALLAAFQHLTVISTNPPPPNVDLANAAHQLKLAVKAEKAKKK